MYFNPSERLGPGSILSGPHHMRLDGGGIGELARRGLVLVEFIGIDPAAAVEGFVLRGHGAAGQESDRSEEQEGEHGEAQ